MSSDDFSTISTRNLSMAWNQLHGKSFDNFFSYFVLQCKHSVYIAVKFFRPQMSIGSSFNKLCVDAYPVSNPPYTAFQNIFDIQFGSNICDLYYFAFVSKCRVTGDNK